MASLVWVSYSRIPSLFSSSCPANTPFSVQTEVFPPLSKLSQYPVQLDMSTVIEWFLAISDNVCAAFSTPTADLATLVR